MRDDRRLCGKDGVSSYMIIVDMRVDYIANVTRSEFLHLAEQLIGGFRRACLDEENPVRTDRCKVEKIECRIVIDLVQASREMRDPDPLVSLGFCGAQRKRCDE